MLPIVTALLTPHVQALRRPSSSLARGVAALPAGCVFVLYSTYSFLPPPDDIRKSEVLLPSGQGISVAVLPLFLTSSS